MAVPIISSNRILSLKVDGGTGHSRWQLTCVWEQHLNNAIGIFNENEYKITSRSLRRGKSIGIQSRLLLTFEAHNIDPEEIMMLSLKFPTLHYE